MPARDTPNYDARLVRVLLAGTSDAPRAAAILLERNDPQSIDAAIALVDAHGSLSPSALVQLRRAYDAHRHLREMPCD